MRISIGYFRGKSESTLAAKTSKEKGLNFCAKNLINFKEEQIMIRLEN